MRSHKYIAKIGSGTNARYFYTQEEYDAYRNSISRPHSRTPKYAKTWYGATETATVSKGNKVGLKTGIRKAKKGTPVSGAPSEHVTSSLKNAGVKGRENLQAKHDKFNTAYEKMKRDNEAEKEWQASQKKKKAKRKKRIKNLVNGIFGG